MPQYDAFAAGNMPVVLFNLDNSEGNKARSREEAEKTISTLNASQRPTLLFYSSPKEILVAETGIDLLVAKVEFDELEGFHRLRYSLFP